MKKAGAIIPELMQNLTTKPVTRFYPFEAAKAPKGYRGVPRFLWERCVGCQLCVKDCTAEAIEIQPVPSPEPPPNPDGTPGKAPKRFRMVLYIDRCVHCARCAEVCNKDAIYLDEEYEMANFTRGALKLVEGPTD
jgi:formate hydrogenlyase subunit 6/NADH:ubiquinone oxidoreductase subunit I